MPARRRRQRRQVDVDRVEEPPNARAAVGVHRTAIFSLLCLACVSLLYFTWHSRHAHENVVVFSDVPFKVVDIPGKGKGVIATRDIQQGERLIREKPLFRVPSQVSSSPTALLMSLVNSLDQAERDSFFDLSSNILGSAVDSEEEIGRLALSIFETNAIAAGDTAGIFPQTARLNHGCSRAFNAVYSWREDEGVIVVHTLRPVKNGSELLTTYTNTRRPRVERRHFLQSHYHFHCNCEVCSLPDAQSQESDGRLTAMSELYRRLATWAQGSIAGPQAIQLINEIWTIGEEEGYWSERGQLAADAVHVAVAHSDASSAKKWALLSARWFGYELGNDSIQALNVAQIADHPESHRFWTTRPAAYVDGPCFVNRK